MVLLTTTPRMLEAISALPASALTSLQDVTTDDRLPKDTTSPISHKTLIALAKLHRRDGVDRRHDNRNATEEAGGNQAVISSEGKKETGKYSLNYLLYGTRPYIAPPAPKPEPTPEFTALMARLRAEAEKREYLQLLSQTEHTRTTKPFNDKESDSDLNNNEEDDEDPITPSLVINIFLSIVFCGVAVFQVSRWYGNEATRVLLSLAAAILVGIAEVVVYAAYVRNVKRGRRRERGRKEKKFNLGAYTGQEGGLIFDGTGREVGRDLRGGDEKIGVVVEEKDVIWGKGKHGGMRKRVRTKWEKDQEREPQQKKEENGT